MKNTYLSKFIKSYDKTKNKNINYVVNIVNDTKNRKDIYNILNKMQSSNYSNCQDVCSENEKLAFKRCEEIVNDNEIIYQQDIDQFQESLRRANQETQYYANMINEKDDQIDQLNRKAIYIDNYIYLYNNLLSYIVYFNRIFDKSYFYNNLSIEQLISAEYSQLLIRSEYYKYFLKEFGFRDDYIDEEELDEEELEQEELYEEIEDIDEFEDEDKLDIEIFYRYLSQFDIDFNKINVIFFRVLDSLRITTIQKLKDAQADINELEDQVNNLEDEVVKLQKEIEELLKKQKETTTKTNKETNFLDTTIVKQQKEIQKLNDENAILRDKIQNLESQNRNVKPR